MAENDYERIRTLAQTDPGAFAKLMREVKSKTVIPHAAQQPVLQAKARFKVMNCGRRFGKTVLAAKMAVAATRKKNQMVWWVAPYYRITKRGYAEVLKQLPDGVLTHDPPPESNFDAGRSVILRFKNGSRMEFYSAERPEGMLGAAVDFCVMDEAAIMPGRIWNQIVSPTLIDHKGRALMISTPRGHNWFFKVWQKGQDPLQTEWASWTFTTQDNPTLPPGEADRMAADMPRMEADQEIYAKFVAAGSSVFIWDERALQDGIVREDGLVVDSDTGQLNRWKPRGHVALGVDLARTTDYTVFYGNRMDDRRCCYFERLQAVTWPEQKRRLRRAVRTLMRNGAENVMLIIDSTGVGDPIVEDMEADGFDVVPINFTTHKANMVRLLAKDLEEAQAFILEDAGTDEFRQYGMSVTPSGKFTYSAPEGEHDDLVSAKMLGHWGTVNEGFGEVRLLTTSDDPRPDSQSADSDPWDASLDGGWDDLLDEETPEMLGQAAAAVGLANPYERPTPEQLMNQPDLWF